MIWYIPEVNVFLICYDSINKLKIINKHFFRKTHIYQNTVKQINNLLLQIRNNHLTVLLPDLALLDSFIFIEQYKFRQKDIFSTK